MSLPDAQAGAISFAHLAGITAPVHAAKAEAPDDKEKGKAKKAEGEDETDEKMEAEDDDKSAEAPGEGGEDDEPEDDEKDDKKGKAKKAGARGVPAFARGVAQERARWAGVLGSRAFARNPAVGAHLLANTAMDAEAILGVLRDTPAAAAGDGGRASRNPSIGTGAAAAPTGPAATEARWGAAFKRAGIG